MDGRRLGRITISLQTFNRKYVQERLYHLNFIKAETLTFYPHFESFIKPVAFTLGHECEENEAK